MNYYSHHIGDYTVKTAHLSILEDGAYRRLLDRYYTEEQMLTLDESALFRVVRARSDDEKEAVRVVLGEFFTKTPDGWRHGRCDEEIAIYQAKAEKNRINGAKGGRPVNSDNPEITQVVSKVNPEITLTKNQEPITNNHTKTKTMPDGEMFHGVADQVVADFKAMRAKQKVANTRTSIEGIRREATMAGLSLEAALTICCERGWRGFKAEWAVDPPARASPKPEKFDPLAYINRNRTKAPDERTITLDAHGEPMLEMVFATTANPR